MDTSAFDQITSSLTVDLICGPLSPDVLAGASSDDVVELFDLSSDPNLDPITNPSRVVDPKGNTVGVLWHGHWDVDESEFVDDVMERLEPYQLLSAGTTILDAVELFSARDNAVFYVLHIDQIIGVLRYSDLFHPLGRLAFLALALEIEDLALSLCQFEHERERCWQSISDNRRGKATDLFKLRYGREPKPGQEVDRLIACTAITDKATMIWKQQLITP
jgi:hypothetical protein